MIAGFASAATIVTPTSIVLTGDTSDFTGRTINGNEMNWRDGTGFEDAAAMASIAHGATVPGTLPSHAYGWSNGATNSRIRSSSPMNPLPELTLALPSASDLEGLILWGHGEGSAVGAESSRGVSSFTASFSIDGGMSFTGSEALTFAIGPQGGTNGEFIIPGQLVNFSTTFSGVTHVRLSNIDTFAGAPASGNHLVNFAEIRLTAIPEPSSALLGSVALLGLLRRRR